MGLGTNNCDDVAESNRKDSNCTPKGTFYVQGFSDSMPTYSHCRFVTWFQVARGIGFHSHPDVPDYPASHGCVRLDERAAQLIHNNAKIGETKVTVGGKWTRAGDAVY
jgi:lipoprotein-anchoring transpeptidase ErfK/SrfK